MKNISKVSNASVTVVEYNNQTGKANFLMEGYDGHLEDIVTKCVIA